MMLNHWRVHRAWLWLWLLVVSCQQHGSHAQDDQVFFNCELDDYYQIFQGELTLASWDRSDMADLLKDTHREVLPYTSSSREDVWDALVDLDASNDDEDDIDIDRIRLIYAQINIPALPHGVPATWNREHLWPKSRGVGTSGPDYTDIHALRPADWNVNSARSNLFFGDCQDACTSRPANAEAANDTAKNENVFLPPAKVRGDIARAIMYMELRYSFLDEPYTDVLKLTDCPVGDLDSNPSQMAYLSELLEWHIQDPPDEEEKIRNDRACTRWQGNRNIFVDYPDLALMLHGDPKTKPYNCNGEIPSPTPLPTTSPTMNDSPPSNSGEASPSPASAEIKGCSDLSPGDVQIIAINSDNPDSISLVVMENLPPGLELYITDNAWTGTGFRFNEGTAKLQVPSEGIAQGSIFGYGETPLPYTDAWESIGSAPFALSTAGDSVIAYCHNELDGAIVHLGALVSGTWENDVTEFTTNQSARPESLSKVGAVEAESGWDNYAYVGITVGTKAALLEALGDGNNWSGSNTARYIFSGGDFVVLDDDGEIPSPTPLPTTSPTMKDSDEIPSPTPLPTTSPTTNDIPPSNSGEAAPSPASAEIKGCSDLSPGDVQIIAINSDNPDSISLVVMENLPPDLELYITDNAWTGTGFRFNEGTAKLQVPSEGIAQGSIFGYGETPLPYTDAWESIGSAPFALSTAGDSVIAYCRNELDGAIVHLGALVSGTWENDVTEFTTNQSARPESLSKVGAVEAESGWDNYAYVGITVGTKAALLEALGDGNNWSGSNTARYIFSGGDFVVLDDDASSANISGGGLVLQRGSSATSVFGWCSAFVGLISYALSIYF